MKDRENLESEAVAFRLRHGLGPYATKFARHAIENAMCGEEALEELLIKEWDGAIPDSFVSTEEVSRSLMGVLHMFLDFAVKEAVKRKNFSYGEVNISYYAEPYYDDSSVAIVTDMETNTLLCKKYIKTYHLDKEGVEGFLKGVVEETCDGIDLLRERTSGGVEK